MVVGSFFLMKVLCALYKCLEYQSVTSSNIRLGFGIPVVFFLPVRLLARCCPVVSWFMEIMALLGCCPPSSSMENRSSGTEHMLVSERTWKYFTFNFQ